ncbi:conserved hypothetical protein [Trichinella spiralis]|uniref:hypothetical protein n=1 Tax=Trichinella spiralis TaxID=6334 RepID=UPI0001EFE00D|nr:conserved hypothetical protein [Trichinella spiralis]
MAKVEVRIKYCCCCGLNIATLLVALYSLVENCLHFIYILFLGLASWSIWRINNNIPDPQPSTIALAKVSIDDNTVVLVDPYFDTLGLYTEELKYGVGVRYPVLLINILIFLAILVATVLLLIEHFLATVAVDWNGITRRSSRGDVRKIAVGIFFLGLQLFHVS